MEALKRYSDSSDEGVEKKDKKKEHQKRKHDSSSYVPRVKHRSKGRSRSRSPIRKVNYQIPQRGREHQTDTKKTHDKKVSLSVQPSPTPKISSCPVPGLVSISKFESVKDKRKRLWSSKKEAKSNQWENATFSEGGDDAQAKFRRLMGMGSTSSTVNKVQEDDHSTTLKKLEQQYESSRYLTHVARGVGLGFNSAPDSND